MNTDREMMALKLLSQLNFGPLLLQNYINTPARNRKCFLSSLLMSKAKDITGIENFNFTKYLMCYSVLYFLTLFRTSFCDLVQNKGFRVRLVNFVNFFSKRSKAA